MINTLFLLFCFVFVFEFYGSLKICMKSQFWSTACHKGSSMLCTLVKLLKMLNGSSAPCLLFPQRSCRANMYSILYPTCIIFYILSVFCSIFYMYPFRHSICILFYSLYVFYSALSFSPIPTHFSVTTACIPHDWLCLCCHSHLA